jgi:hypothetical protein
MSRPPADEIQRLRAVAREMIESGDESGYHVGVAVAEHSSFGNTRRPSSSMERELFLDAARGAASREGLGIDEASGGLDLIAVEGSHIRRYRVKGGERTAKGNLKFVCGLGSSLLSTEPDGLLIEEHWILGYLSSDDHTIEEVIAAQIVGKEGNGPVKLVLGPIIPLTNPPLPDGFTSTDEGLDGFEDDDEKGNAGAA